MRNTPWVPLPDPMKAAEEIGGLIPGAMYGLQLEASGAYIDLQESLFEANRDGEPTDVGIMVAR